MADSIQKLKYKIQALEKENRYLKDLLTQAGITYEILPDINTSLFDLRSAPNIVETTITAEKANLFFSMFWGRKDVYSKRAVRKSTGAASYFPQCYNFWKDGCRRKEGSKVKCKDCHM